MVNFHSYVNLPEGRCGIFMNFPPLVDHFPKETIWVFHTKAPPQEGFMSCAQMMSLIGSIKEIVVSIWNLYIYIYHVMLIFM
jgi:hypothetical protein